MIASARRVLLFFFLSLLATATAAAGTKHPIVHKPHPTFRQLHSHVRGAVAPHHRILKRHHLAHIAVPQGRVREAIVVADAASGAVLRAINAGDPWYPASLTKMMTAYMAFDAMESGQLQRHEELHVSAHAAEQSGSRLGLRTGDTLTVDTALRSLFVRSANDSAVALAERISGSESAFGVAMTARAHAIGMTHSHFHNATGLPDPEQITTAHDMAVLAHTLIQHYPAYSHYYQAEEMTFRNRSLGTVNSLLKVYPGAEGMKTGFTCASGYNIVASARRNDRRLIAVYLGGASRNQRTDQVAHLLNEGFEDARPFQQLMRLGDPSLIQASLPQPIHRLSCGEDFDAPTPAVPSPRRWSVIVGMFPRADDAQKALGRLRSNSPEIIANAGKTTVFARRHGNGTRYAALVSGLSSDEADGLCSKHAWEDGINCTPLHPSASHAVQ